MSADQEGLRIRADFNGLFMSAGVLCLSHSETCLDQDGNTVEVRETMSVTAYDKCG